MNIRESRVLAAVQKLGAPSTIDVADLCGYPSAEARSLLKELEHRGVIRANGRRWTIPSAALSMDPPPEGEVEEAGVGTAVEACVLIFVIALILLGIVFVFHGAIHG